MSNLHKSSKNLLNKLKIEPLFQANTGIRKSSTSEGTTQMKLKTSKDTILKEIESHKKKTDSTIEPTKKLANILTQYDKEKHPRFTTTSDKSLDSFKQNVSKSKNLSTQDLDFISSLTMDKYKQICTSNDNEEFIECIQRLKYEIIKNMQFSSLTQTEKNNLTEYATYHIS
jgi:hypothetical protein